MVANARVTDAFAWKVIQTNANARRSSLDHLESDAAASPASTTRNSVDSNPMGALVGLPYEQHPHSYNDPSHLGYAAAPHGHYGGLTPPLVLGAARWEP